MEKLNLVVKASKNGAPYRTIAYGTRDANGVVDLRDIIDLVPQDLFRKLDRQLMECPVSLGTCDYVDGYTTFHVAFSPADFFG